MESVSKIMMEWGMALTDPNTPTVDELESLFVNNDDLDRIEGYLNRFNPIRTMKMARMEIRHSAILAWLLDPAETHGLGDHFLKAFLGEALRGHNLEEPTALDISQSDLRDAEVRPEWRNIDIFVRSESKSWAFIIENKFNSKQSEGQLSKYMDDVRAVFKENDLKVRGVFLTLYGEEPADKNFKSIGYENICEILSVLMNKYSNIISNEVNIFLKHYLEIIKDEAAMNEELKEMEMLARQLYRKHKKALDFVNAHGAGSDFAIAARNLFGEDPDRFSDFTIAEQHFVFCSLGNSSASFLPKSWYEALKGCEWAGCEKWWADLPMITVLEILSDKAGKGGQLRLHAEVGRLSDHDLRSKFIDKIKNLKLNNIQFQARAQNDGQKYSRFFRSNSIKIHDIHRSEEISNAIEKLLNSFKNHFEKIGEMLIDWKNNNWLGDIGDSHGSDTK